MQICCNWRGFQQLESLREKLNHDSHEMSRQMTISEQAGARIHALEEEKAHLEARLHKADAELSACDLSREGLKRDKCTVGAYNM